PPPSVVRTGDQPPTLPPPPSAPPPSQTLIGYRHPARRLTAAAVFAVAAVVMTGITAVVVLGPSGDQWGTPTSDGARLAVEPAGLGATFAMPGRADHHRTNRTGAA